METADEHAGSVGRTEVSSLTEMVSKVTGDSEVGGSSAAGKQKIMSP